MRFCNVRQPRFCRPNTIEILLVDKTNTRVNESKRIGDWGKADTFQFYNDLECVLIVSSNTENRVVDPMSCDGDRTPKRSAGPSTSSTQFYPCFSTTPQRFIRRLRLMLSICAGFSSSRHVEAPSKQVRPNLPAMASKKFIASKAQRRHAGRRSCSEKVVPGTTARTEALSWVAAPAVAVLLFLAACRPAAIAETGEMNANNTLSLRMAEDAAAEVRSAG